MCYINSGKGSYAASDRRFDHTFPSLILNLMVNIRLKDVNTKLLHNAAYYKPSMNFLLFCSKICYVHVWRSELVLSIFEWLLKTGFTAPVYSYAISFFVAFSCLFSGTK